MEFDDSTALLLERLADLDAPIQRVPDPPGRQKALVGRRAAAVFASVALIVGIAALLWIRPSTTATVTEGPEEQKGTSQSGTSVTTSTARPPDGATPLMFNALSPRSPGFDANAATGGLQFRVSSLTATHSIQLSDTERWTSLSGAVFRPGFEPGLLVWMSQRRPTLIDLNIDGSVDETVESRAFGTIVDPHGARFGPSGRVLWLTKTSDVTGKTSVERIDILVASESTKFEIDYGGRLVSATQDELFVAVDQMTSSLVPDEILYRVSSDGSVTMAERPDGALTEILSVDKDRTVAILAGGAKLELYGTASREESRFVDPPDGFQWMRINNIPTPSFSTSPGVQSDNDEIVVGLRRSGEQRVTELALVDVQDGTTTLLEANGSPISSAYFSWTGELVVLNPSAEGFTVTTSGGAEYRIDDSVYALR